MNLTNRSFRDFHVYTFSATTTPPPNSKPWRLPRRYTQRPVAFDHNSISIQPIDTKFEETVVYEAFDDLVQYGRYRQLKAIKITIDNTANSVSHHQAIHLPRQYDTHPSIHNYDKCQTSPQGSQGPSLWNNQACNT